jgi:hypothetical protein
MNKKYEKQLYRIIKKGVQERVFSKDDGSWTDEQKTAKKHVRKSSIHERMQSRLFWTYEEKLMTMIP